jgi:hypothetical protein
MSLKSIILFLYFQVSFTHKTSLSYSYTNDIFESNYDYIMHLFSLNEKHRYIRMKQIMDDYNSLPTFTPSSLPTFTPSISMFPTESPSVTPSIEWSESPLNMPTRKPSFRPSHIPTQLPSKLIFKVPTFQPSYEQNYTFEPYNISS